MGDLDIGDIRNGDQDTLSYHNEWAILRLATSIFNGNTISDEKFEGEILLNI